MKPSKPFSLLGLTVLVGTTCNRFHTHNKKEKALPHSFSLMFNDSMKLLCPSCLANSSLQIFVVGANDVASVCVYSGVDAVICINAFVLTCQPLEASGANCRDDVDLCWPSHWFSNRGKLGGREWNQFPVLFSIRSVLPLGSSKTCIMFSASFQLLDVGSKSETPKGLRRSKHM